MPGAWEFTRNVVTDPVRLPGVPRRRVRVEIFRRFGFLNVVELTVLAALEQSREHVYQAALLDPNTAATLTTTQTVAMRDDLFDPHRDLLPPALRR